MKLRTKIGAARRVWAKLFRAIFLLASALPTEAALIVRDGGMVYDTVYNLTWLQDANYANTHGFDFSGGTMDWDTASNWVSTLNVGGFTDWRLPSDDDFWPWFKNELCDYSDPANPHLLSSPFTNIQFGDSSPVVSYWTSNLTLVVDSGMSWWDADAFWPYKGYFPGFPIDPNDGYWVYVWPVRTGDVIVPVTRPILRIFQTTINDVVLAWPTNSIGFTLQRNTSLATTNWTSVTNVIRVNGTNNQVSIALVSSNTFFRLTHP